MQIKTELITQSFKLYFFKTITVRKVERKSDVSVLQLPCHCAVILNVNCGLCSVNCKIFHVNTECVALGWITA